MNVFAKCNVRSYRSTREKAVDLAAHDPTFAARERASKALPIKPTNVRQSIIAAEYVATCGGTGEKQDRAEYRLSRSMIPPGDFRNRGEKASKRCLKHGNRSETKDRQIRGLTSIRAAINPVRAARDLHYDWRHPLFGDSSLRAINRISRGEKSLLRNGKLEDDRIRGWPSAPN